MSALNYKSFLSRRASISQPSPIRVYALEMLQDVDPDNFFNFAGGLPNDDGFYIKGATFKMKDGSTLDLSTKEMTEAQQYNWSDGFPSLREWLTELVVREHRPPLIDHPDQDRRIRVAVNAGANQGISTATDILLSPGDKILVPEYYYAAYVEMIRRIEGEAITYAVEEDGPVISRLEEILSRWDPADTETWSQRPKMLYIIPNGSNPSGETTSLEKRRQIYALARKYDLIILEDDSYYFMQFSQTKLPSFLSMDEDGRVIRCDSFSKVLGPGFRVGWITGPNFLITRIVYEIQHTIQHASIFAQVTLNKILRQWGTDEFVRRSDDLRDFYLKRRDMAVEAADKHLKGLATWSVPQGGMFLWVKLTTIPDSDKFICAHAVDNGFMAAPGRIFTMEEKPCPYLRLAFGLLSKEELHEGMKRMAVTLKKATQSSTTDGGGDM